MHIREFEYMCSNNITLYSRKVDIPIFYSFHSWKKTATNWFFSSKIQWKKLLISFKITMFFSWNKKWLFGNYYTTVKKMFTFYGDRRVVYWPVIVVNSTYTYSATSAILQIFMIFIALSGLDNSPLSPIFADHINQMVSCHVVFGKLRIMI